MTPWLPNSYITQEEMDCDIVDALDMREEYHGYLREGMSQKEAMELIRAAGGICDWECRLTVCDWPMHSNTF
jgi:hypothetical protein